MGWVLLGRTLCSACCQLGLNHPGLNWAGNPKRLALMAGGGCWLLVRALRDLSVTCACHSMAAVFWDSISRVSLPGRRQQRLPVLLKARPREWYSVTFSLFYWWNRRRASPVSITTFQFGRERQRMPTMTIVAYMRCNKKESIVFWKWLNWRTVVGLLVFWRVQYLMKCYSNDNILIFS